MSKRFTLQILLPVEGYEEDKIYESEDIALRMANLKEKPDDEFLVKRKKAITAREQLVKTIQSGEVDYKDIREIIEYNESVDNYNVERLSAIILFDLTRNTGFEVSKGSVGECWIKSCCEWEERMPDDICGLDVSRLSLKEKMKQICEGTSLLRQFQNIGLEVAL